MPKFLHEIISNKAVTIPEKPALIWNNEEINFALLQENIDLAKNAILNSSDRGDRIAILGLNNPIYVELLYAIPSYDRISVPLNIRLSTSALVDQINELGVKLIGWSLFYIKLF